MSDDTKKCPYCAETIKAAAIVCRYCGRDLAAVSTLETTRPKWTGKSWLVVAIIAVLIVVVIGVYLNYQENAKQEEAARILARSDTYEEYMAGLEAAGLEDYALSRSLFEMIKEKFEGTTP